MNLLPALVRGRASTLQRTTADLGRSLSPARLVRLGGLPYGCARTIPARQDCKDYQCQLQARPVFLSRGGFLYAASGQVQASGPACETASSSCLPPAGRQPRGAFGPPSRRFGALRSHQARPAKAQRAVFTAAWVIPACLRCRRRRVHREERWWAGCPAEDGSDI